MSTCPRCHGHLTREHRCPRSRTSLALELGGTALVGGLAAIVFAAVFDPHETTADLDLLVFATGALAALALHRVFGWIRRPR